MARGHPNGREILRHKTQAPRVASPGRRALLGGRSNGVAIQQEVRDIQPHDATPRAFSGYATHVVRRPRSFFWPRLRTFSLGPSHPLDVVHGRWSGSKHVERSRSATACAPRWMGNSWPPRRRFFLADFSRLESSAMRKLGSLGIRPWAPGLVSRLDDSPQSPVANKKSPPLSRRAF